MHTHFLRMRNQVRAVAAALAVVALAAAVTPAAALADTTRTQQKTGASRTLDAINIEGEIAVPQVLFITSRDYRRYRDGLGLKFRMGSLDVARSIDLPTTLRFVTKHEEEEK